MSSEFQARKQSDLLQNANVLSNGDWAMQNVPLVKAWRVDATTAAFHCPACGGYHRNNVGRFYILGQMVTRELTCPQPFRFNDLPSINLDLQPERPPPAMLRVHRQNWPVDDLYNSWRLVARGNRTSTARLARSGPDEDDAWGPTREDVKLALRTLWRCGGLNERKAVREELGELSSKAAWRAAGADVWRNAAGRTFREKLGHALLACWREVGR